MLLVSTSLFAQAQSGNIFGKVVDNQKAALPGVTVTLSGPGASQVFVTDAEGQFRFLNLSPGSYSLQAELSGFGSVVRNNVAVNIGRNSNVEMELSPALEQTITVTAETPLLDTRKTGTGATVTTVELEEVPTARDPWVIMAQVPGVLMDRVNVGGNESGQQSQLVSKGASGDQATFNVDGVNITDMAAQGSSPAYYDFGSFEEIQVSTGGTDPRVQTPGAQLNMVTKRGTNELTGSARYYLADGSWQSTPTIPAEGVGYLGKVNEIDRNQEYGVDIGGPIVKDRLWLWGAYGMQNVDLFVAQPPGQTVRYTDKTELETFNYKLNAQLTSSNSAVGTWANNDKVKLGRNASPTRPPETTWNQGHFGPKGIWKLEDTHIFNPNFYLTGMYSEVNGGFQLIANNGQDCRDFDCGISGDRAAYLDYSPTGDYGWHQSYVSLTILRPQKQYRADASYFFDTGSANHELKFGFGYRETGSNTHYAWPQNQLVIWYDGNFGTPANFGGVELVRPAGTAPWWTEYNEFYAGDTILIGNLTAQVGFRIDNQKTYSDDSSAPAQPLIPDVLPAISLSGDQFGQMKWDSVSPRLGLTYSLGEQKKTLLRAAYNRYVDQLGGSGGAGNNYNFYYSYIYTYFYDANGDKTAQADELLRNDDGSVYLAGFYNVDPEDPSRATFFRRFDKNVDAPETDELIFGVEHEITPEFTVGLTYTHRDLDKFLWSRPEKTQGAGDYFTTADYVMGGTLTGTLPDGTTVSQPYYVLADGLPSSSTYRVTQNRPGYSQTYDGLEFTAVKRLSNRWMLRGNFSWNDWTQSVNANGIIDPTVQRTGYGCNNCDGSIVVQGSGSGSGSKGGIYINSKWAYVITGLYQIPVIETNLGVNISGRQGYPVPYVMQTGYFSKEGGRKNVLMDGVAPSRNPDIFTLDMRLSKELRFGGVGVTVSLDAFNVTNEQTVLQRQTLLYRSGSKRSDYNHIRELVSPQIFRIGARLTF